MVSVLLLTFTVPGLISNGYHKAYARGNLDALGTKIRESINNQITEELSGSSGLTTPPSNSTSTIPTTLTVDFFQLGPREAPEYVVQGYLKTDTGSPIAGADIYLTFAYSNGETSGMSGPEVTDEYGHYHTTPLDLVCTRPPSECLDEYPNGNIVTVTAHFNGLSGMYYPPSGFIASESPTQSVPSPF
jgi:hypothetical protein